MSSNEKFPHVMTGPEHLELGLQLAAAAQAAIVDGAPHEARKQARDGSYAGVVADLVANMDAGGAAALAAVAQLAQVHIGAAQVLVFATLAAGEDFGEPWAALVDPTGAMREAAEWRAALLAAERKAEQDERDREFKERLATYNGDDDSARYYPTGYNAGPLVPGAAGYKPLLTQEQIKAASADLAASLLEDEGEAPR